MVDISGIIDPGGMTSVVDISGVNKKKQRGRLNWLRRSYEKYIPVVGRRSIKNI